MYATGFMYYAQKVNTKATASDPLPLVIRNWGVNDFSDHFPNQF